MEQEKLTELIKIIMADKRILDMIRNSINDKCDLIMIETNADFECLPIDCRENVFCQEQQNGSNGFLSYADAVERQWKQIRIFQPSLNLIAKLALGIADEPILKIVQGRLMEGSDQIEVVQLSAFAKVKAENYKKLFLGYLEKIKSFGIKVEDRGSSDNGNRSPAAVIYNENPAENAVTSLWQYKALTERDLRDIEKGTVLTVGKKCIVTSLAVDMARRKSIQICREGEGK